MADTIMSNYGMSSACSRRTLKPAAYFELRRASPNDPNAVRSQIGSIEQTSFIFKYLVYVALSLSDLVWPMINRLVRKFGQDLCAWHILEQETVSFGDGNRIQGNRSAEVLKTHQYKLLQLRSTATLTVPNASAELSCNVTTTQC